MESLKTWFLQSKISPTAWVDYRIRWRCWRIDSDPSSTRWMRYPSEVWRVILLWLVCPTRTRVSSFSARLLHSWRRRTCHIISLVKDKFRAVLPAEDITACHHLPKGGVVLRIHNRKKVSTWESIIQRMKEGVWPDVNVFFNIQLTKHRSNLLFEVQKLKNENKHFLLTKTDILRANDKEKHSITHSWD